MKKLLALTLTMAMLFTMTAMAEEIKTDSHDVTATYKEGVNGGTIYSIDIEWGSLAFTYNAESSGTWDPGTHTYNDKAEAEWTCDPGANVVKVINHSNAELTANVSFSSTVDGVSGTFDKNELKLATAVGTDKDKAPNDSAYLTLDGELPKSEDSVIVGSVTVSIDSVDISTDFDKPNVNFSIAKMTTESNFDLSSGLKINVQGTNLDMITDENFDQLIEISVYSRNEEKIKTLPVSTSNLATYTATSSTTATITYERLYFAEMGGVVNITGEIENPKYKIINNTDENIQVIN